MSISPPSDIILDVARAADPTRAAAAAARLNASATDAAAFGATLDAFAEAEAAPGSTAGSLAALAGGTAAGEGDSPDEAGIALAAGLPFDSAGALTRLRSDGPGGAEAGTYRRFEAMVLASFVESMLPADSALFGEGTAGSVWRAMLAEQIAGEMASGGGIGIAAQLASAAEAGNGAAA
jgi:hypothetical protein